MRLKIKAGQLKKTIKAVWPSVTSSVYDEIRRFAPILLIAERGLLKIHAAAIKRYSWAEAEAEVETEGKVCASSHILLEISGALDDDAIIEMATEETESGFDELIIKAEKSVWRSHVRDAESFRVFGIEEGYTFKFDLPTFRKILNEASPATARRAPEQFSLNAIEIKRVVYEDEKLDVIRVATTDGHRIHLIEADILKEIKVDRGDFDVLDGKGILVASDITKVMATFPEDDETVEVSFPMGKAYMAMRSGSITQGVQLIGGRFPDYEKIIELTEPESSIKVNRKDLTKAVRGARILGDISIKLKAQELELSVSAEKRIDRDKSERSSMEIEGSLDGKPFEVNLTPKYLSDTLSVISDAEEVELVYSGEVSPLIVKHPDRYFRSFVMPVR